MSSAMPPRHEHRQHSQALTAKCRNNRSGPTAHSAAPKKIAVASVRMCTVISTCAARRNGWIFEGTNIPATAITATVDERIETPVRVNAPRNACIRVVAIANKWLCVDCKKSEYPSIKCTTCSTAIAMTLATLICITASMSQPCVHAAASVPQSTNTTPSDANSAIRRFANAAASTPNITATPTPDVKRSVTSDRWAATAFAHDADVCSTRTRPYPAPATCASSALAMASMSS
mmetsp:Transcript_50823/g.58446  ORF Transcript_50823/g.58446 Transcript_50823/m.58446 type:complete len:233 (-) Transcript_50823:411-1109(-)